MCEFFRSYNEEVFKPSMKWYKKHWKRLVVLDAVVYCAEFGFIFREQIKDAIQDKIDSRKKNKELTKKD